MSIGSHDDDLAMVEAFGKVIHLTPKAGVKRDFKAIFNNEFFLNQGFGEVGVNGSQPHLILDVETAKGIIRDDGIAIDGEVEAYTVLKSKPDGTGMTMIILMEV